MTDTEDDASELSMPLGAGERPLGSRATLPQKASPLRQPRIQNMHIARGIGCAATIGLLTACATDYVAPAAGTETAVAIFSIPGPTPEIVHVFAYDNANCKNVQIIGTLGNFKSLDNPRIRIEVPAGKPFTYYFRHDESTGYMGGFTSCGATLTFVPQPNRTYEIDYGRCRAITYVSDPTAGGMRRVEPSVQFARKQCTY